MGRRPASRVNASENATFFAKTRVCLVLSRVGEPVRENRAVGLIGTSYEREVTLSVSGPYFLQRDVPGYYLPLAMRHFGGDQLRRAPPFVFTEDSVGRRKEESQIVPLGKDAGTFECRSNPKNMAMR